MHIPPHALATSFSSSRGVSTSEGMPDLISQKTGKFPLDALVGMLARIGEPVTLAIG